MWGPLLAKDFRRVQRNPLPWLINLALPLCITALLGLSFAPGSEGGSLGRIRFALVDEDRSTLLELLRGALNQRQASQYLEPVFLERAAALRQLQDNQLSAVLVIPMDFGRDYLAGNPPRPLELIKNPAQSLSPAVLEELLGALVTALNAVRQTLGAELSQWEPVFDGRGDYRRVAELITQTGDRLQAAGKYLFPPLVGFSQAQQPSPKKGAAALNLFGYVLPGMAAMFLLFIASTALVDLHREVRLGTVARYHTLRHSLLDFVGAKVGLACAQLWFASLVLLGGGGALFQVSWRRPDALAGLALGYGLFCAGFMGVVAALCRNERQAETLSSLTGLIVGVAGGCAFPARQLPALFRDFLAPLLPNYWFTETVRTLEFENAAASWVWASVGSAGLGVALIVLAAALFRRRLERGAGL